jgi:hypothetical protein
MTTTIPELPLLTLSDDELGLLTALRTDLLSQRFKLELLDAYFNGEQIVRDLGISIPPQLQRLHTVIGWPRIGVESLEQRLDLRHSAGPTDLTLPIWRRSPSRTISTTSRRWHTWMH